MYGGINAGIEDGREIEGDHGEHPVRGEAVFKHMFSCSVVLQEHIGSRVET